MSSYKIASAVLRYIVPFMYKGKFEEVCGLVDKITADGKTVWSHYDGKTDKTESDVYPFVKYEFLWQDDVNISKKTGLTWQLTQEYKKHLESFSLCYLESEARNKNGFIEKKRINQNNLRITEAHLMLFRNQVGLIWYEIEGCSNKNGHPFDKWNSDMLIAFQNQTKELNCAVRGARQGQFWRKIKTLAGTEPSAETAPRFAVRFTTAYSDKKGTHNRYDYYRPFFFGAWIQEIMYGLNSVFFAERTAGYTNGLKRLYRFGKEQGNHLKPQLNHLSDEPIDDPAVTGNEDEWKLPYEKAPDKAILFTFCAFHPHESESNSQENSELTRRENISELTKREKISYWLTNGYKQSYHFNPENRDQMVRPFSDVIYYATKEGASYLCWPESDGYDFFTGTLLGKIKGDYFSMYIRALFQSYSLLHYEERIRTELPADPSVFYSGHKEGETIRKLYTDVNVFLANSMATSVSHINHQSEFYTYVKQQLKIKEDAESVISGLEALDRIQQYQMQRQEEETRRKAEKEEAERDAKTARLLSFITVLTVASALIDWHSYAGSFDEPFRIFLRKIAGFPGGTVTAGSIISFIVSIAMIVYAIIIFVKFMKDIRSHKRH